MQLRARRVAASTFWVLLVIGCDTRSHGVDHDGGGTPPPGCVSTRVCADRLDCEDGERCNTALADPVCQRIRCGTEGSACSEADLCTDGLVCSGGVCREGVDWAAACHSQCERAVAGGCSDATDCDATCADAEVELERARARAETAGCASEFDAVVSCLLGAGDPCDTERCSVQNDAFTDCFVAFCTDNPDSTACTAG